MVYYVKFNGTSVRLKFSSLRKKKLLHSDLSACVYSQSQSDIYMYIFTHTRNAMYTCLHLYTVTEAKLNLGAGQSTISSVDNEDGDEYLSIEVL